MSVRIVHGANERRFPVVGNTIGQIRRGLRDVFNIPGDAIGLLNGHESPDDTTLQDGDNLEFIKVKGRKGGVAEFWSESEIIELFGGQAITELSDAGIEPVNEPVYAKEQIATWLSLKSSQSTVSPTGRPPIVVDFQTMTLRIGDQKPVTINSTLKYRILSRLARRLGVYVHFDVLKRDVWELEDTEDETVSREIRRLRKALKDLGLRDVTLEINSHRVALQLH